MELTITSALALFTLITLSTGVFFASKRLKVPYTVLLVLVGLVLVPVVNIPFLSPFIGFLDDMVLTPELLFYVFLPMLIFESGFNMRIRKMLDSAWTISLLSIVSLCVSVATIASLVYFTMPLIGIEIPFIVALLFGAIISPTDPVAALSLFKECGVPKRLAMIFEGESLFNDGTAMALFLVILSIAIGGYNGTETLAYGVFDFAVMIVLGIAIGLIMAAIFTRAVRYTKKNEFVTITLLLVSAHMVFILTELINQSGIIHVSSIIATTVSSLFLGNYSRTTLPPHVDHYMDKVIEHLAFVVNSLVFLMAGLLFASSNIDFNVLWQPILITVLVVAFARIVAVYSVILPLNGLKLEAPIPSSWSKLLAWASLRGALSIIIVLLIPADFTVPGWNLDYSPRDFLLSLTIGCILATLFIKAPLIGPIMRRYKISDTTPLKHAHEADLGIYYLLAERSRLLTYKTKGFVSNDQYKVLVKHLNKKLKTAEKNRLKLVEQYGRMVFDQSLHLTMVHAEKEAVKKLFMNEEVSEKTYRKIMSKLTLQQEKIEHDQHMHIDPRQYTDRKDIFDRLVAFVQHPFNKEASTEQSPQERLEHYRAQMIMARKALKVVEHMQTEFNHPVFLTETYDEVGALYRRYKERSGEKADMMISKYKKELTPYLHKLAMRSLAASGARALDYLQQAGLLNEETEENILHHYCVDENEFLKSIQDLK